MPYLRLWIIEIFLEKLMPSVGDSVYRLVEDMRAQLGVRPMALLARKLRMLDWVRERKEIWNNHSPWDRRAIIWAASVLPPDEKRFWLQRVQGSGDLLEGVVAGAVMGM
jgi:hypothetical protein